MSYIQIKEKDYLEAHKQGTPEVKKALETMKPELFNGGYPCLKKYSGPFDESKCVVLFTSKRTGSVVIPGHRYKLGYYSPVWNEKIFIPVKELKEVE
jgi:aldehyde:ferredoxin oxidoreductase